MTSLSLRSWCNIPDRPSGLLTVLSVFVETPVHSNCRGAVNLPMDALGAIPSGLPIGELTSKKSGNVIGSAEVRGPLVSLAMEDEIVYKGLLVALRRFRSTSFLRCDFDVFVFDAAVFV